MTTIFVAVAAYAAGFYYARNSGSINTLLIVMWDRVKALVGR